MIVGLMFVVFRIVRDTKTGVVLSTDDYFYKNGHYQFVPEELPKAHKNNQDLTEKVLFIN